MFDHSNIEETSFKVASLGKRISAWIIDAVLAYGLLTAIIGLAGLYYGDPYMFVNIIFFYEEMSIFGIGSAGIILFIYFVVFEYAFGATIGKSAMGLAIVSTTGESPSFLAIVFNSFGKSLALGFDIFAAICFVHYEEDETNLEQRVSQALSKIVVIEVPKSNLVPLTRFVNS
ncbi:MAG: RDD family protein [Candidatus Hodarchaeales archaeon]